MYIFIIQRIALYFRSMCYIKIDIMIMIIRQEMQENEGNLEVAADLQEQLDKLEERALELDRLRSASISSVRSVATPGVRPEKSPVFHCRFWHQFSILKHGGRNLQFFVHPSVLFSRS